MGRGEPGRRSLTAAARVFTLLVVACSAPEPARTTDVVELSTQSDDGRLRSRLEALGARLDDSWALLAEHDLGGDGSPDLIAAVVFQGPGEQRDRAFVVVRDLDSDPEMLRFDPKDTNPGIARWRRFLAVDFDGDGYEDIVEQRQFHIGAGEPQDYCLVMRHDADSLTGVYEARSYGECSLVDLDADSVAELIEITNEFQLPITALWPVVHRWREGAWQAAPEDFPAFYRERVPSYEKALREAREGSANYQKRAGEPNPLDLAIVEAMETYLARIAEMTSRR